ncbi:SDR family oxidoreductase [Parapedobacter lycopersici]|uniref:SDR family oxidoreductase n=1 Tax=Parapedobacter lycopersici TaxID=1864939 RepID=UPI0033413FF0
MENLTAYLPEHVNGKNALITGGTTGIGRATAILLAAQGAKVVIFGRHEPELNDALEAITRVSPDNTPYGFTADVATEEGVQQIFEHTDKHLETLDILVNNAAIAFDSIISGSYKEWKYVTDTNLLGYMACVNEAVKRMKPQKSGHIVNIGSISADERDKDSSVYVATKAGIQGFTEALRKEVNELGIKVTLIEPGLVGSDMIEVPAEEQPKEIQALKMLKAEDIAMSVLYCLSQPKRSDVIYLQIRPHLQIL